MFPVTMDFPPTGEESITSAITSEEQTRYAFSNTLYYNQYAIEQKEDLIRYDTQLQLQRQFDRLMNQLQDEWSTYRDNFSGVTFPEVQEVASNLAATLLHTSPEKMSVELTVDATVFLSCIYSGMNAYVEAHFEPKEETEVVVNVYEDKKSVFAFGGSLAESLQAFFTFLSNR